MSNLDQELKKRYDEYYDQLGKDFKDYKNQNEQFLDTANWKKFSKQIIHTRDQILDNKFKEELVKKYKSLDSRFKGNYAENFIKFDVEEIRQNHKLHFKKEGIERYISKISTEEILEIVAEFLAYEDFITNNNKGNISVFHLDPLNLTSGSNRHNANNSNLEIDKRRINQRPSITIQKTSFERKINKNLTSLSVPETCLFVNLIKKHKIIINDEIELTNVSLGQCFSILTAYSDKQLSQGLSTVKTNFESIDKSKLKGLLRAMLASLD